MPYPPMFVWLGMLRILPASGEGASGASSCVNVPNETQQTTLYGIQVKCAHMFVPIDILFILLYLWECPCCFNPTCVWDSM